MMSDGRSFPIIIIIIITILSSMLPASCRRVGGFPAGRAAESDRTQETDCSRRRHTPRPSIGNDFMGANAFTVGSLQSDAPSRLIHEDFLQTQPKPIRLVQSTLLQFAIFIHPNQAVKIGYGRHCASDKKSTASASKCTGKIVLLLGAHLL